MDIFHAVRDTVFWKWRRGSWQHEFLCLAFIASLIFIPVNSNGWFNEGESVELPDGSVVSLHRYNTSLYLTWSDDGPAPREEALRSFVSERFGSDAVLAPETELEEWKFRIIPRGLE